MMFFNLNGFSSIWMFGMLIMLIIAYLVSMDANSVGENGTLWFFVVLFIPMMGLFLYIIVRSINKNPSANYNCPNSVATAPPITEPVRTRNGIPSNDKDLSKSHYDNQAEFQFCTTCGFQNLTESTFCKSCGIKLI